MKVMRFNDSIEAPALILGTIPIPEPNEGEEKTRQRLKISLWDANRPRRF
jgi:hypothetical protein